MTCQKRLFEVLHFKNVRHNLSEAWSSWNFDQSSGPFKGAPGGISVVKDLFCGRDDEATRAGRHCCLQLWQTRLAVFMEVS